MAVQKVQAEIAGRVLSLETGRIAKQSHGAVVARYGDTIVLSTVLTAPSQRDIDFFPLYVDYREAQYAAGKVPGGWFKREGRPTGKEILTMRLIDRPIRPLFPDDFVDEVQIQCMVLSCDEDNDPDMLAMIASSAALYLSPAPFDGPVGAARVGYVDGKFVVNPSYKERDEGQMDLLVAGPAEAINMIELSGTEVEEHVVAEGTAKGYEASRTVVDLIRQLASKVNVRKAYVPKPLPEDLKRLVMERCGERIRQGKLIADKVQRNQTVAAIQDELLKQLCPEDVENTQYQPEQVKAAFYKAEGKIQRELILSGVRPDGRKNFEVRPLGIEVGVLPRVHGSALFSRGETMALAITTLGTPRDEQIIEGLREDYKKKFMLHYNFPPFSVGEIRPIRGPGRREIGHGALAEKSLEAVMPSIEAFPYTVRVVTDIMESNGSTSQAAVTGGCLSLMDAGVPLKAPVAGISVGMVSEGDRYVLLTDIIGEEDFHGDMDFKVAGTANGITGIQLDMKARGIPQNRIAESLQRARDARLYILQEMAKVLAAPRPQISEFAPRMITIKIDPQKIGKVIGPGGKMINKIQDQTGATIDIDDDGTIFIASATGGGAEAAKAMVESIVEEVQVGRIYMGKVVSIREFGAFIEILPGKDGLCHVSELDDKYVKKPQDVVKLDDMLKVKVIGVDDQGKVKLSRKAVLKEEKGAGQ
ncbi:MAG: polyribonucleotide nucleotidyltransferase [Planctomycetes bacterium]|nr:polyribonucleotide nucleotidyltransferase [Planctomycetota bacterium]